MREIIRNLKRRGTTVFLNSHLLNEVESVCDRAAVIDRGSVIVIDSMIALKGICSTVRLRATGLSADGAASPASPGPCGAVPHWRSLVLMTFALCTSTKMAPMTGGIIAVALFGVAWIAGMLQLAAAAFHNSTLIAGTTIVSLLMPTDGLWRGAVYNLEPAAVNAAADAAADSGLGPGAPFGVAAPPSVALLIWTTSWMIAVLALAILNFSRRDL